VGRALRALSPTLVSQQTEAIFRAIPRATAGKHARIPGIVEAHRMVRFKVGTPGWGIVRTSGTTPGVGLRLE